MSIIKYYFNLNIDEDINYQNRITWKNAGKNLNIDKEKFEEDRLKRLIEYESMLPIILMDDNKINNNFIPLIEYYYFMLLPLLTQKISKPKVLIFSDDYGILNNYYKNIYDNNLYITFVSTQTKENEEKLSEEVILDNNNKINASSYEEGFKKLKCEKTLFDIIIVENIFNENKDETSLPLLTNNYEALLTSNGILSFNLRSCSPNEQNKRIGSLKKKFKKIKILNFRLCSDFLVCSNDTNIQIRNDFHIKYSKLFELKNIGEFLSLFINDFES